MDLTSRHLCVVPRLMGIGGMVSFQDRFKQELEKRGALVTHELGEAGYEAVLVIGGTKDILALRQAKARGVPIIQRLNGMNWIHRHRRTGVRHYLKAEWGNWLIKTIRSRLVSAVVYQSKFAQSWWERVYGPTPAPSSVVYNGVDLNIYSPTGPEQPPTDRIRMLVVEGRLAGGYELGLEHALTLAGLLSTKLTKPIELTIVGQASDDLQPTDSQHPNVILNWAGMIEPVHIPAMDRSAHVLFSADIHPACPNSVIEALAVGLPVIAFATGALPEMVEGDAGCLVPYGSDSWKLEPPDFEALAQGAMEVLEEQGRYRKGARVQAVAKFGISKTVEGYLSALAWN